MDLTIRGKAFEFRPNSWILAGRPQKRPFADDYDRADVFTWNCEMQQIIWHMNAAQTGIIGAPTIPVFYEQPDFYNPEEDKALTARMTAKVFRHLGITKMKELIADLAQVFGSHFFRLDYAQFDWLKPVATYVLRLEIKYKWFEASTPNKTFRFYVGIPHEARLEADVAAFCDLDAFEKGVDGGRRTASDDIMAGQTNEASRRVRRDHLEDERKLYRGFDVMGGYQRRRREIDDELRDLAGDGD